jgi:type IX secretion system PorP/SprF family membrane protein
VRASHRWQWSRLPGAPVTSYISAHAPLGKLNNERNAQANPLRSAYNERDDHVTSQVPRHHSLGGLALRDQTGNYTRYQFNVSYGYHLPLTKTFTMSMAVSSGIIYNTIDLNRIKLSNDNDPVLAGTGAEVTPDLNLGIWLYGKKFFAGLSGLQLIPARYSFIDNPGVANRVSSSYFLIAGYRLTPVSQKAQVVASSLLRHTSALPLEIEGSLKAVYDQRFWAGVVGKSNQSVALFFGMAINANFDFSYSFDYGGNRLDYFGNGSHEFNLGFRFNNKLKLLCPEQLW